MEQTMNENEGIEAPQEIESSQDVGDFNFDFGTSLNMDMGFQSENITAGLGSEGLNLFEELGI